MSKTGSIEFWTFSEIDVSVYVLDDGNNETFVADLGPDASSTQSTAPDQKWIVKEKSTGKTVGSITGTASYQLYEIKVKKEAGGKSGPKSGGSGGD